MKCEKGLGRKFLEIVFYDRKGLLRIVLYSKYLGVCGRDST